MTHYDVRYSGNDTPEDEAKALADTLQYMGPKRFNNVIEMLREEDPPLTQRQFELGMSFAGVQGYPVKVLYRFVYRKQWDENEESES